MKHPLGGQSIKDLGWPKQVFEFFGCVLDYSIL
jgi:hypothetical protein